MHVYKFMSFENAIVRHQIWFKMGLICVDMYTHHTCTMYTYFHGGVTRIPHCTSYCVRRDLGLVFLCSFIRSPEPEA